MMLLAFWILVLATGAPKLAAQNVVLESSAQHPTATLSESTSKRVTIYQLQFDLELTNRSDRVIALPGPSHGTAGVADAVVLAVEVQLADGSWKILTEGSFYGDNSTKYSDCAAVPPGAITRMTALHVTLPMLNTRATELGTQPRLRLSINMYCKKPDDKVSYQATTTAALQVLLPSPTK
jgi:hypothetical protein